MATPPKVRIASMTMKEAIHAIKQQLQVILGYGQDNPKIVDAVHAIIALMPSNPVLLTRKHERRRKGDRRKGDRRKGDRRRKHKVISKNKKKNRA